MILIITLRSFNKLLLIFVLDNNALFAVDLLLVMFRCLFVYSVLCVYSPVSYLHNIQLSSILPWTDLQFQIRRQTSLKKSQIWCHWGNDINLQCVNVVDTSWTCSHTCVSTVSIWPLTASLNSSRQTSFCGNSTCC